jgi:hypothetical protein
MDGGMTISQDDDGVKNGGLFEGSRSIGHAPMTTTPTYCGRAS